MKTYQKLFNVITLCMVLASCKSIKNIEKGYVKIFNGKNLEGWEGDPTYWSVRNGVMTGEVTPETILKRNTFLIWRKGVTSDFELKVDYRVSVQGNSGINYRSEEVKDLPLALKGYQEDIDGANRYTGQNYEERGRGFLALPGQKVLLVQNESPKITVTTGDPTQVKTEINSDWNKCHIIAKGNKLQHFINDVLMSEVIDQDTSKRKFTGLLGVQVHVGPPMKIEYKNFRIKSIK